MPVSTLQQLRDIFRAFRVETVYVKQLAPKQDNDKNQIYLGKGLDGVTNLFAAQMAVRSASESKAKRKSAAGKPKLEAVIDFAWVSENGDLVSAPNTRIIDYFQYPEVRMSGFLKGSPGAPDSMRRRLQAQFGRRILALGVDPDGRVLGHVLTERDDPLVREFPELPVFEAAPIFRVLVLSDTSGATPLQLLRADLARIRETGWHSARIMRAGGLSVPFRGNQGAGYTLEALLGVIANARKAPDKYGFEIKTYGGARISLMTPTPDGGFQGTHTFRQFMARYGHPGEKGDGSIRFTGLHRCGAENPKTNMVLRLSGFDSAANRFSSDPAEIAVELVHLPIGNIVASWSLEHMANAWNTKHASAAYIPSSKRPAPPGSPHDREYSYGPTMLVGQGTDVWKLLRAIHAGAVYYDPADSIYADGLSKVRPQWRINAARLYQALLPLYGSVEEFRL